MLRAHCRCARVPQSMKGDYDIVRGREESLWWAFDTDDVTRPWSGVACMIGKERGGSRGGAGVWLRRAVHDDQRNAWAA